jgi:hypothetical protein
MFDAKVNTRKPGKRSAGITNAWMVVFGGSAKEHEVMIATHVIAGENKANENLAKIENRNSLIGRHRHAHATHPGTRDPQTLR